MYLVGRSIVGFESPEERQTLGSLASPVAVPSACGAPPRDETPEISCRKDPEEHKQWRAEHGKSMERHTQQRTGATHTHKHKIHIRLTGTTHTLRSYFGVSGLLRLGEGGGGGVAHFCLLSTHPSGGPPPFIEEKISFSPDEKRVLFTGRLC